MKKFATIPSKKLREENESKGINPNYATSKYCDTLEELINLMESYCPAEIDLHNHPVGKVEVEDLSKNIFDELLWELPAQDAQKAVRMTYSDYLELLEQKRKFCMENDDIDYLLYGRTEENQKQIDGFDKQIYNYTHANPYKIYVLEGSCYVEKMYLNTLEKAVEFAKNQITDNITSVRVVYVPNGKDVYYKTFDYDSNTWFEKRL